MEFHTVPCIVRMPQIAVANSENHEGDLHMDAPPARCHTVQQALQMLAIQETDSPRPHWSISKRHCLQSTNDRWKVMNACKEM